MSEPGGAFEFLGVSIAAVQHGASAPRQQHLALAPTFFHQEVGIGARPVAIELAGGGEPSTPAH